MGKPQSHRNQLPYLHQPKSAWNDPATHINTINSSKCYTSHQYKEPYQEFLHHYHSNLQILEHQQLVAGYSFFVYS